MLVTSTLGDTGGLEHPVDLDRPPTVLRLAHIRLVVRAQQPLQGTRAVGPAEHRRHQVGGDLESGGERFRGAPDEALHRGLVVVDETLRRFGLRRFAACFRVVTGLGQRPCVLDHVVRCLHPDVTVRVEARASRPTGQLMELAYGEDRAPAIRRTW